uniref:Ribonuclease A-domain domain-containing protein n=1 Tax=Electrophorus electricus TaxID=8005 RepID=A0AAY5E8U0_ELEEL
MVRKPSQRQDIAKVRKDTWLCSTTSGLLKNERTGKCKKSNTFILDEISNVRKVCRNGTHSNFNVNVRSPFQSKTFDIVNCTLKSEKSRRTITVACVKGWPVVHFPPPAPPV